MKKVLAITLVGLLFASCNAKQQQGNVEETNDSTVVDSTKVQNQSEEQVAEDVPDMTYQEAAGIYDSLDDQMNSVSRFSLNADGTATWGMIGSLNLTEYTYTIHGRTICLKPKGVDSEEDCYDYDPDTRSMKNEQGAVYYRQVDF